MEFPVLAVSGEEGQIGNQSDARVVGQVVEEGRGAKILVFHYKRKKQYKKLRGHRQAYTAVRITEIAFGGQSFKAPELPKKEAKPKKVKAAEAEEHDAPKAKKAKREEGCSEEGGKKSARRRNNYLDGRMRPSRQPATEPATRTDLWRIKKGKALHETGAIRTRSGLDLRHSAGRSCPAAPSSCGSAARA